jgi:transcriptional regulator with XRE-family HTH domain
MDRGCVDFGILTKSSDHGAKLSAVTGLPETTMGLSMHTFAELLRSFRSLEGLSQKSLADSIGVSRNTVGNWDRGDYLPRDIRYVHRIADVLYLLPEERAALLRAAGYPGKDDADQIVIRLETGDIVITPEDRSSVMRFANSLPESTTSESLAKPQIKEIARKFGLLEKRRINGHLRYDDGDISYWYEQNSSSDELVLKFASRKVVLDAAERDAVEILNQGKLSEVANSLLTWLQRSI